MCYESSLPVSLRVKADGCSDVRVLLCVCVRTLARGRRRARQSFRCVRCTWCAAHRWVGYAGWAQRGLAEIAAISPTSIITHNYTLNGLKKRVTTNQPSNHGGREKWSFINGPIYMSRRTPFLCFLLPISRYQLAFVLQFCSLEAPPWHHPPQPKGMFYSWCNADPQIQKPAFARAHHRFQWADGETNLVLINGKSKGPQTGEDLPALTHLQHLRDQRGLFHMQSKSPFRAWQPINTSLKS